jgi:hypothetical protein
MVLAATTMNAARISILLSLVHLLAGCAGASSVATPSPTLAAPSAVASTEESAPRASPTRAEAASGAALACSRALLAGQEQSVVDCMPAVAVTALGGRDSAVAALTTA